MKLPKILCIFIVLTFLVSGAAYGTTIKVPEDYPTIQQAIDAAVNGDIVEVASGTYKGTGNRDLDFNGKEITVRSKNGPNGTIIDCEEMGRGFYLHSGETENSVIDGFTITNGSINDTGGGIKCENASLKIVDCIIIGNSSTGAGGIDSRHGSLHIDNTIIKNNYSHYRGSGGGLHVWNGSLIMNNSFVIGNSAPYNDGGGIYCHTSSCEIVNSVIAGNSSEETGGGLVFDYGSDNKIVNCTIVGNQSPNANGAAISVINGAHVTLTNCIVSENMGDTAFDEKYCSGSSSITLDYCDTFNNSPDGCVNITRNNCLGSPPTAGLDPLFVDPANYKFHLTSSSPCIDTGTSEGAPNHDFEGDFRPQGSGYDIGVDEYLLNVFIKILPKVLNFKSRGRIIISWIRLSEEYDPYDIARDSLELFIPSCSDCEEIYPTCEFPFRKRYFAVFPRQDLIEEIETMNLDLPARLSLKITGELDDGTPFGGSDTIRIIDRKRWRGRK